MASDLFLSISNLDNDEEQQRKWGTYVPGGETPEDPRRKTLDPTTTWETRKESSGPSIDNKTDMLSTLFKLAAGGMRAGTGIAGSSIAMVPGLGTALGAGVGGLGEGLAQLLEDPHRNLGNLDKTRIMTEAGLTAIPLSKVYQAGRPLASAVGGGLLSALGIGARRASEGQSILPKTKGQAAADIGSIALGSGIGGIVGALPGPSPRLPIQGPPVLNPSLPKITDLEDAMGRGRGLSTLEEKALQEQLAKENPTSPFFKQAQRYKKQQETRLTEEARSLEAQRRYQEAEKARKAAEKRVADLTEGLKPGKPKASQTFTTDIEGGKEKVVVPFEAPEDEVGTKTIKLGPDGKPIPPSTEPPTFDSPEMKSRLSDKGKAQMGPQGPGQSPAPDSIKNLETKIANLKSILSRLPSNHPERPDAEQVLNEAETLLKQLKPGKTPPPTGSTLPVNPPSPTDPFAQFGRDIPGGGGPKTPKPPASKIPPIQLPRTVGDEQDMNALRDQLNALPAPEVHTAPPPAAKPVEAPPTPPSTPATPPVVTGAAKPRYWDDTLAAIEDPLQLLKLAEQPGGALRLARHYGAMREAQAMGLPVNEKAREAAGKAAMVIKGALSPEDQAVIAKEIEDFNARFPKGKRSKPVSGKLTPEGEAKYKAAHDKFQAAVDKGNAPAPATPTEPPPPQGGSRIGPGQTSKAREAALAKRKAGQAEASQGAEADKATAENLQSDLDNLANLSPEERAAKIKEMKSGKKGLGDQTGAIDPVLMARIAGGLGGAALGYETDPLDNPVASAAAGGAGGALAGGGLVNFLNRPRTPNVNGSSLQNLWKQLPNATRSNLLFSGSGLGANALAGPWGGATLGALEEGLGAGSPEARSAGYKALRSLLNPVNFPREFFKSFKPAVDRITLSEELGRSGMTGIGPIDMLHPTIKDIGKTYMAAPGVAMVMGDEAAGNLLTKAGVPDDRMMRITLRNEPESAFGRSLQHMLKTKDVSGKHPNVIGQLALPFNRTNMNVMERGLGNMPGLGLMDIARAGQALADPTRRRVAQQGIGAAVMVGSEYIGESTDPETAKVLRKYIVNAAGPYSLQAAIGFTYGQAKRQGKSNPALEAFVTAPADATPLPSFNLITDYGKALVKTIQGNPTMPKAAVPRFLTNSDPWGVGDVFNLFEDKP